MFKILVPVSYVAQFYIAFFGLICDVGWSYYYFLYPYFRHSLRGSIGSLTVFSLRSITIYMCR